MSRRRYLIAYDISNDKRLRRVISIMERYGERLQYSVFLCDLTGAERAEWEMDIRSAIKTTEDSVVTIDLGPLGSSAKLQTIGTARRLPSSGATIV